MDFLYGIIGLVGFEALRIYKRIWANLPFTPRRNVGLYLLTICCLAFFSGFAAHALANGSIVNSMFVGFSVPTGLKALTDKPHKSLESRKGELVVDDIEIGKPGLMRELRHWVLNFFRFS